MKDIIYFFSSTGNTQIIAERSAKTLSAEIRSMKNGYTGVPENISGLRIGFFFPLYYLSFPKIVEEYIMQMKIPSNAYIYAIVTRGFGPAGGVLGELNKILVNKGTRLRYGTFITMPNNDCILFNGADTKKAEMILQKAYEKMDTILNDIKEFKNRKDFELFAPLRPFRKRAYLSELKKVEKLFYADNNCTGCTICEKICHHHNIVFQDSRPQWRSNCDLCEGCINFCPTEAIQFGTMTKGKRRYHHPNVSSKELY